MNLPYFRDQLRGGVADTKLAEVITGALAFSYGLQAIGTGTSQFKTLMVAQGGSVMWGSLLILLGISSILFAYTHAHKIRFIVALLLMLAWAAIAAMFAGAELSGPPMYNGLILMAVACRIMVGAVRHEKQTHGHHP
jgi:hypothetical protein